MRDLLHATMSLVFESTVDAPIFFSGTPDPALVNKQPGIAQNRGFHHGQPGVSVPTFVIANYQKLAPNDLLTIQYLPGQEDGAKEYAEVAANIDPILAVGGGSGSLQILGLPDPDAASFVSDGMLLCPLKSPMTNEASAGHRVRQGPPCRCHPQELGSKKVLRITRKPRSSRMTTAGRPRSTT